MHSSMNNLQYHAAPQRLMPMYIIQVTTPLWKDQMLHFGALMYNSTLKYSHQCATETPAGSLILSVIVLLLDQV